ncbi:MAG: 6-hydroxymethylpterin diphosphokinase MptE-like protein [Rhodospirillales bacterium]
MSENRPETQEQRDALRARNLEAFKRHSIDTANRLLAHKPATELVFDEDGQPDVEFQGQKFYDGQYDEYVKKQIEAYRKNPYRIGLAIPQPSDFDVYGERFLTDTLKRATLEADAQFSKHLPSLKTFFVTVLGIGLGGHLSEIAEFSNCRVMYIIDPNIENLYHSLELFDWEALMDSRAAKGGQVLFMIGNNSVAHFNNVRAHVRWCNTPGMDGLLIYTHYNNPVFTEILREFDKNTHLFLAGLGFYNDECKMLENTHRNLSGGSAHIYTRQDDPLIPYPCFIVGCGPSLDADLVHIKNLADKAIIISSGSALGPLLNAGITPDFQIEVENEGILPVMQHVAEHHDISEICLVTSTTAEPEIVDYFKRIIYHFRPALSPYGIFSDNPANTIPYHDPSVVNSSLGFAQDLGFREFYFFGCDMGTKNPKLHHARNSYHFAPDAVLPDNDFCIPIPANFGGTTYTSSGLYWVKSSLEMAMTQKRLGRSYYNCSDGGHLEKAIAKFAKSVSLPAQKNPNFKIEFVQSTFAKCPVMETETFAGFWDQDRVRAATDQCFDNLLDIIANAAFLLDKDYQIEINKILFFGKTPLDRGICTWVRGTLQMMLLAVEFYGNRLIGSDSELAFEEIIREELTHALEDMHSRSIELINKLN